jgi:hypothetical protein
MIADADTANVPWWSTTTVGIEGIDNRGRLFDWR